MSYSVAKVLKTTVVNTPQVTIRNSVMWCNYMYMYEVHVIDVNMR